MLIDSHCHIDDARFDVDRDAMWWAVDEAVRHGLVASTAEIQCGADGLCGTSVPTVLSLARA